MKILIACAEVRSLVSRLHRALFNGFLICQFYQVRAKLSDQNRAQCVMCAILRANLPLWQTQSCHSMQRGRISRRQEHMIEPELRERSKNIQFCYIDGDFLYVDFLRQKLSRTKTIIW